MPVKVVDASAIGALLFGEPEAVFVSSALKETKMVAPFLISLEVTNICLKKIRRHPDQQETIRNAFAHPRRKRNFRSRDRKPPLQRH